MKNNCSELNELYKKYRNCQECPLSKMGRTQVVFGVGNPNAKLMFIGEAPGRNEDLQGEPFVGRAGKLLNTILEDIGIHKKEIYITNIVKCRPPNNRTPSLIETESCSKLILLNEINIIKPKMLCTLGASAAKALLGNNTKISEVRGNFQLFNNIPLMPTYHPAFLLRNPSKKLTVWKDLEKMLLNIKN